MAHSTAVCRGIVVPVAVALWVLGAPALPASAATTVTIQPIVRGIGSTGDQAPGRITGFRFWGVLDVQRPVINDAGEVVFRGFTAGLSRNDSPAFGIYSHRPAFPLAVLVDTTVDTAGNPVFAVPGRPVDTRFLSFDAPVLNNNGDVLFAARFGSASGDSGSGLYAVKTSGGAITKVVDTFDAVPGVTGELFTGFASGFSVAFNGLTEAVLNDSGVVVFRGKFGVFSAGSHGLYAGSVSGTAPILLADSTQSLVPTGFLVAGGLREVRPEFALSNAGIVAFHGSVGTSFSSGVFAVPATGGTVVTVASRFQPVPGTTTTFTSFDAQDINEAGQVLFRGNPTGGGNGLYGGSAAGGPLSAIVDTLGGFAVPGNDPAASFTALFFGPLNESGGTGFASRIINAGNANSQGLYTANVSGSAPGLVIDTTQPAPGVVPPVNLTDFIGFAGNTVAMNDAGNLAFSAKADIVGGTVRGLYFFDTCSGSIARIVDSTTSLAVLGSAFSTTGGQTTKLDLYQGKDAISGHYRGLNTGNDVAFLAQFSNFDFGIYVAHIQAGGGGGTTITCPADAVVECGAATDPSSTGSATAADSCTGTAVATASTDVTVVGTGGTETITRTWTADDGSGVVATCVQTVSVLDTTAPILTGVPANATVECDAVPAPTNPTVSDTCDASPALTFAETMALGTCLDEFTLTRSWTGTDGSNNAVTQDQVILVADTVSPTVTCPADLALSGGFGGTNVSFTTSAADNCDPAAGVATNVASGSFFNTGVTTVTAIAMDRCSNSASCAFDVLVSCFGVNRAKIGTRDFACRGIEEIEFTSMNGTEELISLFKAAEGSGGGAEEDTLPPSIIVDDGVNGPVTVDTSCVQALAIGDVFGPYTVTDIEKDFDDFPDSHGNQVELRGSFVPAAPFDLTIDDLVLALDDGQGHIASFTIPAGSFQIDGNPAKGKFKFEGNVGVADVKAKLKDCEFKFKAKNATNTGLLAGNTMSVTLAVGRNVATETLVMENKGNHLKFKRKPKVNCCPECIGVASMQVTSDQGVLVFQPPAGSSKLSSNTVVDDSVNGSVTIHTSCSQPIAVGDTFGAYTVSELIKVFE